MSIYKLGVSSGHYNDEGTCKQTISVVGIWAFPSLVLIGVSLDLFLIHYPVHVQFLSAQAKQSVSVLCNPDLDCTVW